MIKKIKGSLFIKVFITTAILLTGVSFLVYLILAWYTPKTYSNTLNATLDEQTKIFISEISQMPMEETGGIFDNFLDYQNVDRMELFEENGNRINLPTERSADNDVVIETKAWGNEDNNAPIISNSYTVSFLGKNTNYTLVVYGAAGQVAELQRAFQKVFPLLAFIVFCVSLVTGWIFSHLITKPVLKISRISKEMSELQFEWQLDEQRTDELGILAKSLNYLSQKLNVTLNDLQAANRKLELDIEHEKALEQARTNFFSAVSHELKTPITIIKGQLEGMLLGIGPYKDHADYGITYNEQSGGWYYNNQRIKILLDSEQAVVYTDEENGVCVTISRDGNHQISEIKEISETDAQSLMLKNNPIGEDYTSQE